MTSKRARVPRDIRRAEKLLERHGLNSFAAYIGAAREAKSRNDSAVYTIIVRAAQMAGHALKDIELHVAAKEVG